MRDNNDNNEKKEYVDIQRLNPAIKIVATTGKMRALSPRVDMHFAQSLLHSTHKYSMCVFIRKF